MLLHLQTWKLTGGKAHIAPYLAAGLQGGIFDSFVAINRLKKIDKLLNQG